MSKLVGKTIRVQTPNWGVLEVIVLERIIENGWVRYICQIPSVNDVNGILIVSPDGMLSIIQTDIDEDSKARWQSSVNFNSLSIEERSKEMASHE